MFRREDIKFITHGNASAVGLQKCLDQVAVLYDQGYRLATSEELGGPTRAKLYPWRVAMVKAGTKSIEELERETPEYVLRQFNEVPDNANGEVLDAFCSTYGVEIKETDKRPVTRYRKLIKEQLQAAIKSSEPIVAEDEQPEPPADEPQETPTE